MKILLLGSESQECERSRTCLAQEEQPRGAHRPATSGWVMNRDAPEGAIPLASCWPLPLVGGRGTISPEYMGSSGEGAQQFRVSEVAAILGTNPRQVEGWVEQGFLKPAAPGSGPGHPSYFDYPNLLHGALTLAFQRTFGAKAPVWGRVAGSVAKTLAEEEERLAGSSLAPLIMLVSYQDEKPAFIQMTSMERMDVAIRRELKQGRTLVILGLRSVVKTLHERLAAFKARSASREG